MRNLAVVKSVHSSRCTALVVAHLNRAMYAFCVSPHLDVQVAGKVYPRYREWSRWSQAVRWQRVSICCPCGVFLKYCIVDTCAGHSLWFFAVGQTIEGVVSLGGANVKSRSIGSFGGITKYVCLGV